MKTSTEKLILRHRPAIFGACAAQRIANACAHRAIHRALGGTGGGAPGKIPQPFRNRSQTSMRKHPMVLPPTALSRKSRHQSAANSPIHHHQGRAGQPTLPASATRSEINPIETLCRHASLNLPDSLTERKIVLLALGKMLKPGHPLHSNVQASLAVLQLAEKSRQDLPRHFAPVNPSSPALQP